MLYARVALGAPSSNENGEMRWWRMSVRTRASVVVSMLLLFAGSACNWLDDPSPDEARLMIDGPAGTRVHLITSTKLLAAVGTDGVTKVEVFEADTTSALLPFESTYSIRDDQAFLALASHLDANLETMRMRVFLDGTEEFDETGPLEEGIDYRFVYAFNQRITPVVDITF